MRSKPAASPRSSPPARAPRTSSQPFGLSVPSAKAHRLTPRRAERISTTTVGFSSAEDAFDDFNHAVSWACTPHRGSATRRPDARKCHMQRTMLKSKIHRAVITDSDLHYVGSITIDADL